ncbi:MAG: sporulation initiation factor Spo0A C-terminal domain-containing protein [Dorea formicigenerans]
MVPLSGSDVSAQDIEQLLRTLGASPVYAGFTPAVTALQYVLADQQLLTSLTTRLYPKVAESCEIALPCVERNIRTMIAVIWEKNQFYSRLLLDIA